MLEEMINNLTSKASIFEVFRKKNWVDTVEDIEEVKKLHIQSCKILSERSFSKLKSREFSLSEFHRELLIFRFFQQSNALIINIGADPFFSNHIWSSGSEVKIVSLFPFLPKFSKFEEMVRENEERFEYKMVSVGVEAKLRDRTYIVPVAGKEVFCSLAVRKETLDSDIYSRLIINEHDVFQGKKARLRFVQVASIGDTVDSLIENGISNFVWRSLEAIYFGLNDSALDALAGAEAAIKFYSPLVVVKNQIDGSKELNFMMSELGYIRVIEKNSVLCPYDLDNENKHDFYVPKCKISDYSAIGLYSAMIE